MVVFNGVRNVGQGRAVFKWAYLASVAIFVGCGDAPQPRAARTCASAPPVQSAHSATQWVLLDQEETPRRPEDLKAILEGLHGEPQWQYRPEQFPIQDYWRWEQQERLRWRVAPSDR